MMRPSVFAKDASERPILIFNIPHTLAFQLHVGNVLDSSKYHNMMLQFSSLPLLYNAPLIEPSVDTLMPGTGLSLHLLIKVVMAGRSFEKDSIVIVTTIGKTLLVLS